MALKHYDFESGTDGANLTTALTGASQVTLNGGTGIFDAAAAHNGYLGMKVVNVAGSAALLRFAADTANTVMAFEVGFTAPTPPASSAAAPFIVSLRNATGPAFRVFVDTAGRIAYDGATQTGFVQAHSGLVAGQHYRLAVLLQVGSSTSNGQVKTNLYAENSTTPMGAQFTSSTWNLGTTAITACDVGVINNSATSYAMSFDDVRFLDGATTEIGPVPTSVMTVRPSSATVGTYTVQGGAASAAAAVSDESDATYVESVGSPANAPIVFTGFPLLATGNVRVQVRARLNPVGGPATTAQIELLQGSSTVIASSGPVPVTDGFVDYVLSLTAAQNAAITNRGTLQVRVTANQP